MLNSSGFAISKFKSKSTSDLLDVVDEDKCSQNSEQIPEVPRQHRLQSRIFQKCRGCRRYIHFVLLRNYCRLCSDVFCLSCTRDSSLNKTTTCNGNLYRVCLFCIRKNEDLQQTFGQSRSWTNELLFVRGQYRRKHNLYEREPVTKLEPEMPSCYFHLVDQFLDDINGQKSKQLKKEAKKASVCSTCKRRLLILKDRKLCSVCGSVSCKKCSSKDLVIFLPRHLLTDTATPRIKITDSKRIGEIADVWRNYRICDPCKCYQDTILKEYDFNFDLETLYTKLTSIQIQINSVLSQELASSTCNLQYPDNFENVQMSVLKLTMRTHSIERLYDNNCNRTTEKADEEILCKLFTQYFSCHRRMTDLKPESKIQQIIHYNIQSASRSFYIEKRSQCRTRFVQWEGEDNDLSISICPDTHNQTPT